jgi:hypothetical protein
VGGERRDQLPCSHSTVKYIHREIVNLGLESQQWILDVSEYISVVNPPKYS